MIAVKIIRLVLVFTGIVATAQDRLCPKRVAFHCHRHAIIFLILLLLSDPLSVFAEKTHKIELTLEEQTWLAEHPDIRFGFSDDFEPYLIKGHDGKHRGILVDFLNELNARLGTQFVTVVDSWPKVFEKIKNKELTGISAIARATADAKGLLKTATTFSVYPSFFIREGAPFKLNSLNDLSGRSVAILQSAGVMEKILEPYSGDVAISKFPTNLEVMKALFEGKVDIAFGLTVNNYLITKYNMRGIKPAYTLLDKPFEVVMGVRPDLPELDCGHPS